MFKNFFCYFKAAGGKNTLEIICNRCQVSHFLSVQGQYKFKCPALKEGTLQKCDALWSYQEVRRLAVLTAEEMQHFEESIACIAAMEFCDYKPVSVLLPSYFCKIQQQNTNRRLMKHHCKALKICLVTWELLRDK